MSYIPRLGSAAQRAISYLGRVKGEVSTADLADAIACTPYGLGRTLGRAVDAGLLIKRQHKAGTSAPLFWSLPAEPAAPKPEPAADIPVVQRTVPAAEAGPSGWTPHPLDAAWHLRANGHAQTDDLRDLPPDVAGQRPAAGARAPRPSRAELPSPRHAEPRRRPRHASPGHRHRQAGEPTHVGRLCGRRAAPGRRREDQRTARGRMTDHPAPLVPAEVAPSLLDPCTCLRDGRPCRVCLLWDKHIAWFEARPEPNRENEQCRARAT